MANRIKVLNYISGKSTLFLLLSAILFSGVLYRQSFTAYYFQDDWFTLNISKTGSLRDWVNFFLPRSDIIYYRPLGMQIPFALMKAFFGLNPRAFHLVTFLTHFLNIFLVYNLMKLILKNKKSASYAAFLYGVSAVNFIPLYWLSTYPFESGPAFFFASFIFIIHYLHTSQERFWVLSLILFLGGILTNEIVLTLPLIAAGYILLLGKFRDVPKVAAHLILAVLFVSIRFVFFAPPTKGLYLISLGTHILSNLKTYLFWSFNWSEVITEQMTRPLIFNSLITDRYLNIIIFFDTAFILILTLMAVGLIKMFFENKPGEGGNFLLFSLGWFVIGLSPVLLFPHHKFTYYLPIALAGFLPAVIKLFEKGSVTLSGGSNLIRRSLVAAFLYLWCLTSWVSVNFNVKEHWAPRRARISAELVQDVGGNFSLTKDGIVKVPFSSENKLALNDQDAFRYLFGEKYITVYEK